MGVSEVGEMKGAFLPPLGMEDNAKLSIFLFSKHPLYFSLQYDIFPDLIAEIFGKL